MQKLYQPTDEVGCTYNLNCAADPVFFEVNGLLTGDGCSYFQCMKRASTFLSRIDGNTEVDQALSDIQTLLSAVVENQLAVAIPSGGNSGDMAIAENKQILVDAFVAKGNFKKATQKRKEAWAYAYNSY